MKEFNQNIVWLRCKFTASRIQRKTIWYRKNEVCNEIFKKDANVLCVVCLSM
jgi:hypothetical protein